MGLYNMLFGENASGRALLATLNLTPGRVGRYRDCYLSEGKIAVYTRNGGGNRRCWCEDNQQHGYSECKGHDWEEEVAELVEEQRELREGERYSNIWVGGTRCIYTGNMVTKTRHTCDEPDSLECACPGCTITYRLPNHPLYISDQDDDFDCTYATIYFRIPDEYRELLAPMNTGEKIDPDARWQTFLAKLEQKGK